MKLPKNAINWVEIPVSDFDRAQKFYSTIYNYDMQTMDNGTVRMGFLLSDPEQRGIGAAIIKGEGCEPSTKGARVYLNGGVNLTTVLDRVEDAGGKVVVQKTQISADMGFFATFEDTEGNRISLHSME